MNNRTKTILTVIGILVVVAIAISVMQNRNAAELLAGTTSLAITPSNPTVIVGATASLSLNAALSCDWNTSDSAVVSFAGNVTQVSAVTIQANENGSATISANCKLLFNKQVTVTNTVNVDLPPITITQDNALNGVGQMTRLTANYTGACQWTSSDPTVIKLISDLGLPENAIIAKELKPGVVTVTAVCGTQTAQKTVNANGTGGPSRQ